MIVVKHYKAQKKSLKCCKEKKEECSNISKEMGNKKTQRINYNLDIIKVEEIARILSTKPQIKTSDRYLIERN